MKASITQRLVSSVKPSAKIYDIADDKLTGFILRVYPSGKLVYYVRPKRGSMRKIGNAPTFTPAQARETASTVIRASTDGKSHPVLDRRIPIETNPTLQQFVDNEYEPFFKANHRSAKNLNNLNVFGGWPDTSCSDPPVSETRLKLMTEDLVAKWCLQRLQAGTNPATINRNVNALRACLSYAVKRKVIPKNPLFGLERLHVEEGERVRYLDKMEEERLRKALDESGDRIRAMTLFSINTGVRRGELFSLLWTDITKSDVGGSSMEVVAIESGKAKNRKTRRIPLNTEAKRELDRWGRKSEGLVFHSNTGKQLTDIRKAFDGVKKKAKLTNFKWHDLRHHFASKLVMAGVPLNTVRELLGHSDIKMTLRYAHLAPGHMREAVELLNIPSGIVRES